MNKLLVLFILLISISQALWCPPNFELWNKSNKNFYFSLGNQQQLPSVDRVRLLGPAQRATQTVDTSVSTKLLLSPYSNPAQGSYDLYTFKPGKTIYVRITNDAGKFGPQSGPLGGFLGRTESGLSLGNNIQTKDIIQETITPKRADEKAQQAALQLSKPSIAIQTAELAQESQKVAKELLGAYYKTKFPQASQEILVREGNSLSVQEIDYTRLRVPKVKQSLELLLGESIPDHAVPRIALCCSGGGYRAMLATLGYMSAELKQNVGIFDIATYAVGLSGSTWALNGWLQSGKALNNYIDFLKSRITKPLEQNVNMPALFLDLLVKYAFNQPLSLIDIYGSLLTQKVLEIPTARLTDIASYSSPEVTPLVMSTAVIADIAHKEGYEWVEFTPYEVASSYLQAAVPVSAFGRKFNAGITQEAGASQPLGYAMGIWGSALSVNIKEIYKSLFKGREAEIIAKIAQDKNVSPELSALLGTFGKYLLDQIEKAINTRAICGDSFRKKLEQVCTTRVYPAQVFNWSFGLKSSALSTESILTVVDAGIDFNLPVPPVLRPERAVDIIIMLDAGADAQNATDLKNAESYAKENALKFPAIDYTRTRQACSVHFGQTPDMPTVIYLPLIKNDNYAKGWNPATASFTSTFNFAYTPQQVDLLTGLANYNITSSRDTIINAIGQVIAAKTKQRVYAQT